MSTPTTRPDPPPAGTTPTGTPTPGRRTARTVSTVAVVTGALVLAGTAASATADTVQSAMRVDDLQVAPTGGVGTLVVDVSAGALDVVVGDVDEAELAVSGSSRPWVLDRDGDVLRVTTADASPGWWPSVWFGDHGEATLTLPGSLDDGSLDATFRASGADLRADGTYDAARAELTGGRLRLGGSASTLDLEVAAGAADVDVADVREAVVSVSAGGVDATLRGTSPQSVDVDVSAGQLTLSLPADTYAVRPDVAAGQLRNDLDTSASAQRQVTVEVAAGTVVLGENS